MQKLFSPWRSKYIESFATPPDPNGCVFCDAIASNNDEEHLVVARGKLCFVIMNLFPYNSGHVMVVPYRHTGDFLELTDEESLETMQFLRKLVAALRESSKPDGFNIGSNIGRSAGAGIDKHIHFHLVPRWNGDTNFMPVLADTKMISEDMKEMYWKLKKGLGG